jgi:hypothetical protein
MAAALRRSWHAASLALIGAGLAIAVAMRAHLGVDYSVDAEPAILALGHGEFRSLGEAAMGPLSLVLRAPVVRWAVDSGQDQLTQYRVGSIACLVPASVIAAALGLHLRRLGRPWHVCLVLVTLLTVNPLVFNALQAGHPEEPLCATLCIAAVVLAPTHTIWAFLALACALATKQWAVVAVGPVLLALPASVRLRGTLIGGTLAIAVVGVYVLLGSGAAWETNARLFAGSEVALPFSPWWLIATGDGPARWVATWIGPATRVATIALPLLATAALLFRNPSRSRETALLLLATALLLRCLLDPADNPYYNIAPVFALAAWEAYRRATVPWLAVSTTLIVWWCVVGPWRHGNVNLVATVYLVWTAGLMIVLFAGLVRAFSGPVTLSRVPRRQLT